MRVVWLLIAIALTGCTTYQNVQSARWTSMPTPQAWHLGQTWSVDIFDRKKNLVDSMTVRFTDAKGDACVSGDWKRVEILSRRVKSEASFGVNDELVYSLQGRALDIGAYAVCDDYSTLQGELTEHGVEGVYFSQSMFSRKALGSFAAHQVSADGT
jgi:hypothetical protein